MISIICHVANDSIGEPAQFYYRVEYFLEGVRVSSIESADLRVCLHEVESKMKMDMGHLKGKVFTLKTGREV